MGVEVVHDQDDLVRGVVDVQQMFERVSSRCGSGGARRRRGANRKGFGHAKIEQVQRRMYSEYSRATARAQRRACSGVGEQLEWFLVHDHDGKAGS